MEITFDDLLTLVGLAVAIFVYWQANRSFPAKETAELIKELSVMSKKTRTEIDDFLVQIAEFINSQRTQPGNPVPGDEGGDANGEFNIERG
jgi:hypothetical protein